MMTKLTLFIIAVIFCSSLAFSQQQNEIIKRVPYKALPGVSTKAPAPGDCSGYLACVLFCPKGAVIIYDIPWGCSCFIVQGFMISITCPPYINCRGGLWFCSDFFPPNDY